jgi:hypothetical protein
VDGSSTGTEVPWMWVLLRPPRFGGATHASGHDNWSRYRQVCFRPHHPFGGGFDVGAGNRHRVGVTGRADLAVLISPGQFHPGLTFVDELADRLKTRIVERVGNFRRLMGL